MGNFLLASMPTEKCGQRVERKQANKQSIWVEWIDWIKSKTFAQKLSVHWFHSTLIVAAPQHMHLCHGRQYKTAMCWRILLTVGSHSITESRLNFILFTNSYWFVFVGFPFELAIVRCSNMRFHERTLVSCFFLSTFYRSSHRHS